MIVSQDLEPQFLSESYLLIKEIALVGDENPNVVAATGIEPVTSSL